MGGRRNVVLVSNPAINGRSDFEAIAARVHELDPTIAAFVVDHVDDWDLRARVRHHLRRLRLATAPTLVVAPHRSDGFSPLRGVVRCGNRMTKVEEHERLLEAGLPTPAQVVWTEDLQPPVDHLGEYVLVKPATGTQAGDVAVMRPSDVEYRVFDNPKVGRSTTMLVQEFIDTNPAPSYFRVLTCFGQALYCELNRLDIDQRTVERGGDPRTRRVTASGDGRLRIMIDDPEVVALAVTAARSFAEVPVCGVDVVREVGSGRLCILEMNTWGYVWHLSSPSGRETQKRLGLDRYGQYGALDVAAQAIAAATRDLLG